MKENFKWKKKIQQKKDLHVAKLHQEKEIQMEKMKMEVELLKQNEIDKQREEIVDGIGS